MRDGRWQQSLGGKTQRLLLTLQQSVAGGKQCYRASPGQGSLICPQPLSWTGLDFSRLEFTFLLAPGIYRCSFGTKRLIVAHPLILRFES